MYLELGVSSQIYTTTVYAGTLHSPIIFKPRAIRSTCLHQPAVPKPQHSVLKVLTCVIRAPLIINGNQTVILSPKV